MNTEELEFSDYGRDYAHGWWMVPVIAIAIMVTLLSAAFAQQEPQPLNDLQLRGINNVCTQDSLGLALQRDRLQRQVEQLTVRLQSTEDAKKKAEQEKKP